MASNTAETTEGNSGIVSKITSFLTTKKGLYCIAAIVLIGAIYFYTRPAKKDTKQQPQIQQNDKQQENKEQQNYQPPPGYVTIPVEMLQGLQQGQVYEDVPEEYDEQLNLPTQQGNIPQQANAQQQESVPRLRHNQEIEDDEEEEIQEQNLSKQEMESIQAQLNAMQQQSSA